MPGISKTVALLLLVFMLISAGLAQDATPLPDGFVYVHEIIADVILDIRYAGTHNFVGDVIDGYEAPYAILTEQAAYALSDAADELRAMGYRIKIFDAYRPKSAVRHFVRWANDAADMRMQDEFYPDFRKKILLVDQGYIARNSPHTRGSAVDLTLTDMEGCEIDMGAPFDFFSEQSWFAFSGISAEQKENRTLLRDVMVKHGFRPFDKEWWHFRLLNEPYPDISFDFAIR